MFSMTVLWRSTVIAFTLCLFTQVNAAQAASTYLETDLVSDQQGKAPFQDANLINAWGIALSPNDTIWVVDGGAGVSTLYDTAGKASNKVVTVPTPPGSSLSRSSPTGIVFNSTNDFVITSANQSAASTFIFATENGTISGWNNSVDNTHAIIAVDNSASGAIYKGLAIGVSNEANFIYATNFHAGTVDVFDGKFKPALAGTFVDPKLPKGFAPFGIRNLNGLIYVTYAVQDEDKEDDVKGKGHGVINIFDTAGTLVRRFASKGALNSPWGMDFAGSNFGSFNGALLVGNFGDGKITAFDFNGKAIGQLQSAPKTPIVIDGLWGLSFGSGCSQEDRNTLFFTAGPSDETHGLFGKITLLKP